MYSNGVYSLGNCDTATARKFHNKQVPSVSNSTHTNSFSNALFNNRFEVNILDIRQAIVSTKNVYPDVIEKSLPQFDQMFEEQIAECKQGSMERLSDETV